MAYAGSLHRRLTRNSYHPQGEDTVFVLLLMVVGVLAMTVGTLVLFEFLMALPPVVRVVVVLSLIVSTAVIVYAIRYRALSLPSVYRGGAPRVPARRLNYR